MSRAADTRAVIKALSECDHSTNNEMGDTYCEFCDGKRLVAIMARLYATTKRRYE